MSNDWNSLPILIKREVLKYLNFKGRCSLRKSSKLNKTLVENEPTTVQELGFTDKIIRGCIALKYQEPSIRMNGMINLRDCNTIGEKMIDDFLRVFDHPKSKVSFLYFILTDTDFVETLEFLIEFYSKLIGRGPLYTIRTRQFNWLCNVEDNHLLKIVERLEPRTLYGIQINCPISSKNLQKLLNTEQCRNAKRLGIGGRCKFVLPIAELFDKDDLHIHTWLITPAEVWETIKNFRSTPRPIGSRFCFCNHNILEIPKLLKLIDVQPPNANEYAGPDVNYVQTFQIENGNNLLKVVIKNRGVTGTIVANQ